MSHEETVAWKATPARRHEIVTRAGIIVSLASLVLLASNAGLASLSWVWSRHPSFQWSTRMGILGDRFVGNWREHKVELVRTNVDKQVVILVDGNEIATESVAIPHTWDQVKEFALGGASHKLHAHSALKKLWGLVPYDNEYAIEIDGEKVVLSSVS
jgi:hypothetical protein